MGTEELENGKAIETDSGEDLQVMESQIDKIIESKDAAEKKAAAEAAASQDEEGAAEVVKPDADEKEDLEVDDSKTGAKEDAKGGEAPKVTDAQIERAIKLGISFADARSADPGFLDRACDALEAKTSGNADAEENGEADAAGEVEVPEIPDLDPEEFDETLVQGWSAMKTLITQQSELIKNLSQGNKTSWFDSQVGALGVDVGDKKDALKTKFDVLAAGYKASGQQIADDAVFAEASSLVLGDELKAAKEKSDEVDLKKRNKMLVNRPTNLGAKSHKDPRSQIIEEIGQEFFGQK